MNTNAFLLSVILPIKNEENFIVQTLAQLVDQTLEKEKYEIIVVDGESTDSTWELVTGFIKDHPTVNISLHNNPKHLSSAARNIGIEQSSGKYVLIIDGHVYLPNIDVLKNYLNNALVSGAKVLGRPQPLNPPDANDFQESVALARTSRLAHSQESFIYSDESKYVSPLSVAVMYDKAVFNEVGYFDEEFDAAEDLEFNYRLEKADYQCYFSQDHAVKYYPRSSLSALFKQLTRYGLGRAKFFSKHPERFTWENIAPTVLFTLSAFTPIMLYTSSITLFLWLLGGLTYASLLFLESIRLKRSVPDKQHKPVLLALIIATIHFGLGYGFLCGLLKQLDPKKVFKVEKRTPKKEMPK